MGHNRENFGALLKSIIGNLKSIIGSGLVSTGKLPKYIVLFKTQCHAQKQALEKFKGENYILLIRNSKLV